MSKLWTFCGLCAAFVVVVMAAVRGTAETSRTAAETFKIATIDGDNDKVEEAYHTLFAAFASNDDVYDFEFDPSLTVATVAHWYSICWQLCDRNNLKDFRETRAALMAGFVGRIEGRLNSRTPDFWNKSFLSFDFRLADDDAEIPFHFYSTTELEELSSLDREKYTIAEPMTARVGQYAGRLGLQPDDCELFFNSKENEIEAKYISDIRLDACQTESADKYLLFYSVGEGSPIYYLRNPRTTKEVRRKVYHNLTMPNQFNFFEIDVAGEFVIVWGVTPASCFFAVHDACDLSLRASFFTSP